jgi:hypothetical protein
MPEDAPDRGSLGKGVGLGVLFTVGGVIVSFATMIAGVGIFLLLGIGVVQALWMIPLYNNFDKKGAMETKKGILIVAGIVFLLNASCWGFVMSGGFKVGG